MEPNEVPEEQLSVVSAAASQGEETYRGTDHWKTDILPIGTRLAQLDYDPDRVDKGYRTASKFFTTEAEARAHQDPETGLVDSRALSERLQVMAYREGRGEPFEHSGFVTIYEVVSPFPVARGVVRDNPTFGKGGAQQFYSAKDPGEIMALSGEHSDRLSGYVAPVEQLKTTSREPGQPFYANVQSAEETADPRRAPKILHTVIEAEHMNFKARLYGSGDPKMIDYAQSMEDREAFSDTARTMLEGADWQAVSEAIMPEGARHPGDVRIAISHMKDPERRTSALGTLDKIEQRRADLARGPERGASAANDQALELD